jgi:DNA-binding NtrC family response regulator
LVVEDEEDMLENCRRLLQAWGYRCLTADDGEVGVQMLAEHRPDVVLTDLRMPRRDGMDLLKAAVQLDEEMVVILFTAYGTVDNAVEAMKAGAFDYLAKPFSADELRLTVERGLRQRNLSRENRELRGQLREKYGLGSIVGKSNAMRQVFETLQKVAKTDANVLVLGETGTGKELIARSLHAHSRRATGPFVPVDCASLPENLLENELFGHEAGAYTDARTVKPGLFEFADTGTLFLDEIGDLSIGLQAKLLRVLEERQFRRIGGNQPVNVDVRVLSATNRDLRNSIDEGTFREELYYRLNVVAITLPPLRERVEDIDLLADRFVEQYRKAAGAPVERISPEAMRMFQLYHWPGNVRELQNVVQRSVLLAEGDTIQLRDLPEYIRMSTASAGVGRSWGGLTFKAAKQRWLAHFEKEYITELVRRTGGNVTRAAELANMNRKTIQRIMNKYGLREAAKPHQDAT